MLRGVTDRSERTASPIAHLLGDRISRLEWAVAGLVAVTLIALTIAEPDILEAPFENSRTVGSPSAARSQRRSRSSSCSVSESGPRSASPCSACRSWPCRGGSSRRSSSMTWSKTNSRRRSPPPSESPTPRTPPANRFLPPRCPIARPTPTATAPAGMPEPVLLGAGPFVGLAGHEGTGDAGVFERPDGSRVLRLENLDIQNGPDLRLYLVPGREQTSPTDSSLYLGELAATSATRPTSYLVSSHWRPATGRSSCGAKPSASNSSAPTSPSRDQLLPRQRPAGAARASACFAAELDRPQR